jgi:hypothetical protein
MKSVSMLKLQEMKRLLFGILFHTRRKLRQTLLISTKSKSISKGIISLFTKITVDNDFVSRKYHAAGHFRWHCLVEVVFNGSTSPDTSKNRDVSPFKPLHHPKR